MRADLKIKVQQQENVDLNNKIDDLKLKGGELSLVTS